MASWLSVRSVLHSKPLSGSAFRNTLQYTLPTNLYPDPTLTNRMACAVQIGMCCANWHSTCPAYLNQINNVTRYQCTCSCLSDLVIVNFLLCDFCLSCSGLHLAGHVMLTPNIIDVKPLPLPPALGATPAYIT